MLFLGLNVNYWYDSYLVKGKADMMRTKGNSHLYAKTCFYSKWSYYATDFSILAPAYSVPEVRVFNPVFIFDSWSVNLHRNSEVLV